MKAAALWTNACCWLVFLILAFVAGAPDVVLAFCWGAGANTLTGAAFATWKIVPRDTVEG